jgi:hypothetical protein
LLLVMLVHLLEAPRIGQGCGQVKWVVTNNLKLNLNVYAYRWALFNPLLS